MKKLKLDFTIDYMTGEKIPVEEYKKKLKLLKGINRTFYYSQIADFYYKEKYNMNIVSVLGKTHDIPKCPVTGEYVSYKLGGHISFGQFSSNCPINKRAKYVAENNESYKIHIEKMKVDRCGPGNPMHGKKAWNDGLTKETNKTMKKISEDKIGTITPEDVKKTQSESAKKRKIHGHTGFKHSEESKQIMREKTIARFKAGSFPQTNSLPHKLTRDVLNELFADSFEEEFKYGGFVFDFKFNNFLIEVQGDYFHCNPNTRHAVPKNDMQKNNLARDKKKHKFVEDSSKYTLLELWEYDIINNIEKIKLCLQNLKK